MIVPESLLVGFNLHLGIQLIEWDDGRCVMELPIGSHLLNRGGVVHGGVLSTLIDAVGSHAGNFAPDPANRARSVTVSLTTQFIGQAAVGPLRAVGTRTGGGKRIFYSRAEIFTPDGAVIACGDITGRKFV